MKKHTLYTFLLLSVLILVPSCKFKAGMLPTIGGDSKMQNEEGAAANTHVSSDSTEGSSSGGGFFSGAYASLKGFVNKLTSGLNWQALKHRMTQLYDHSIGMCARGVRLALNALMGTDKGNGPSACEYDVDYLNRSHKKPGYKWELVTDGTQIPGDVFNCNKNGACDPANGDHGHIEMIADNGTVFSDFKQNGSICLGGGSYTLKGHYRAVPEGMADNNYLKLLSPLTKIAKNFNSLAIPYLEADTSESIQDTDKKVVAIRNEKTIYGPHSGWSIEYSDSSTSSYPPLFVLYKEAATERKEIFRDESTVYAVLKKIPDKKVQRALAKEFVESWIKKQGKELVQKNTKLLPFLNSLQKEALLDAGLELPVSYSLIE